MPQTKLQATPKDEIARFIDLIRQGVEAWERAGALLVEMRRKNPGVFAEIVRRSPMFSIDALQTIERIGLRQLHPKVILTPTMPVRRLIGFPYESQARLCEEPVEVLASIQKGKNVVHRKFLRDMSRAELSRVLADDHVRSVEEQAKWLREFHSEGNAAWQALSNKPVPSAPVMPRPVAGKPITASDIGNPISPATSPNPGGVVTGGNVLGRWVVRKGIGNNCGFERTQARPHDVQFVYLNEGMRVIEVVEIKRS